MSSWLRLVVVASMVSAAAGPPACFAQPPRERVTIEKADSAEVLCVAFSPDSKTLASVGRDPVIRLWDVATGKNTAVLKGHPGEIWSVVFSPDGKLLASGGRGAGLKLWDVKTGKNTATLEGHGDSLFSVAFSPDGKLLASGSADKSVKVWDLKTRKNTATFVGHGAIVYCVTFSPDSKTVASGSVRSHRGTFTLTGEIKLWDVASGKKNLDLEGHTSTVRSLMFSPDGKTLASASEDRTVRLWEIKTGKNTAIHKPEGAVRTYSSVAFSPDGKLLVSAGNGDGWVELWDVETQSQITTLKDHWTQVCTVAFSPDGKTLASGGSTKKIILWDLHPPLKDR